MENIGLSPITTRLEIMPFERGSGISQPTEAFGKPYTSWVSAVETIFITVMSTFIVSRFGPPPSKQLCPKSLDENDYLLWPLLRQ